MAATRYHETHANPIEQDISVGLAGIDLADAALGTLAVIDQGLEESALADQTGETESSPAFLKPQIVCPWHRALFFVQSIPFHGHLPLPE